MEPALRAQEAAHHVLLPCGIREIFTPEPSPWRAEIFDRYHNDFLPIDKLLGLYIPAKRQIVIYHGECVQFAPQIGMSSERLIQIVRLHEYGHALHHIGIPLGESLQTLVAGAGAVSAGPQAGLIAARTQRMQRTQEPTAELVAQLITRTATDLIDRSAPGAKWRDDFERLAKRQPPEYAIPSSLPARVDPATIGLLLGTLHRAGYAMTAALTPDAIVSAVSTLTTANDTAA